MSNYHVTTPKPGVLQHVFRLGVCVRVRARARVLTAWFPGSIHGDFDGAVVGGHLRRSGEHGDCQSEAFSCSKGNRKTILRFYVLLEPSVKRVSSCL